MTDGATWRVGALLYSGRPDPSWTVAPRHAAAWVQAFNDLMPALSPIPNQARLGYRGAWLQSSDGRRWNAFMLIAWHSNDGRADVGRALERKLIESAPAGVLPSEWPSWLVSLDRA